ncbi:hypothetical protein M0654_19970 [Rhizobium sp. NTR19]|uniref:DUF2946 domain-containing protein n=1 Tax=Neorhizobium turbinariae TaxID=2937795 RepID=A0ABT0IWJ3_9HYPH|nr:hypothetical protein [Neorhizobium turbinariae]MCK8782261.1 hypothetical protein [Neorhizobium turbinariae]
MIRRSGFDRQSMVRMLCALALLLVGFAHKPPVLDGYGIPLAEIAQYTLPDGTLPHLCLPSEDGKLHHHGHDASTSCEACRLAASALLPVPGDTIGKPILLQIAHLAPPREDQFHRQLFPSNALPRGPPSA